MNKSMISVSGIEPDHIDVSWIDAHAVHHVGFRVGYETRATLYLTDEDARILHEALGRSIETVAAERAAAEVAKGPELCPKCFGADGHHGVIHVRNEAGGGGSNLPCPNSVTAVQS